MRNPSSKYWVLVADSGNARILEMRRTPYEFREIHKLASETQHKLTQDLVSDGGGRSFHVQGPASHSKEQRSNALDLAEQEFTRKLIDKLELAINMYAFDYLMVIADPRTLGRLLPSMSKALTARVSDEWNLDLAKTPLKPLEKKLKDRLGWSI